jgi:hypothetical protein
LGLVGSPVGKVGGKTSILTDPNGVLSRIDPDIIRIELEIVLRNVTGDPTLKVDL